MKPRIILGMLVLLLTLIVCVWYFTKGTTDEVPGSVTDFSAIGVPTTATNTSFTSLLKQQPDETQQKVLDNIYLDEYYLYPCNITNPPTDVVVLVAQYKPNSAGLNTFQTAQSAVKTFEDDIYPNWGHLIFKDSFNAALSVRNFSEKGVSDPELVTETYRVGLSPDGQTQVYYGWVLNYIVVASSKDCLIETMKQVYSIH